MASEPIDTTPLAEAGAPSDYSSRRGWYLVFLLCLLYAFSFVDRLVLGLLAVDIGRDLAITDTQLSLLIGTSFAIAYSIAGVPIAHFLDRSNRKRLLVAGVVLWSVMTILSGFAPNFLSLAVCRAGVAFGEAVLSPAAVSLIADMFPRNKRIAPTATYAATSSYMTIGALIVGAAALQLARVIAPGIGFVPWRLVLVLVGIPPLLLGVVVALTVREPRRGAHDDPAATRIDDGGIGAFFAYLKANWRFFLPLYLGNSLVTLAIFGMMTWMPAIMIRGHGYDPAGAGYLFGLVGVACGIGGSILWPRVVMMLTARGYRDPVILAIAVSSLIAWPFVAVAPSLTNAALLLVGMGIGIVCNATIGTLMPFAIQTYGPPRFRSRLMSLVMLSQSLIGYALGPLTVALLAKNWPDDGMALGYGLSIVGLIFAPAGWACYTLARRALARRELGL